VSINAGTASSEYRRRVGAVQKVRAFLASDVKPFVERLRGHDDKDYELYQNFAYYLPAAPRTLDAYAGMIMSPEPTVSEMPEEFQPYLDDLTSDGEPFQRVTFRVVEEVSATGRYCLLADYANDPEAENITVLDAERAGLRPFVRGYKWEDILDWRVTSIRGKRTMTHLRLMEYLEEADPANEWETKVRKQVRVLDIFEGKYRVRLYREVYANTRAEATTGAIFEPSMEPYGPEFYPKMNGQFLDYIPAVVFGPNSLDCSQLERPPLLEIVNISHSHLNDSALRQWALMWCGQPVPVLTGLQDREDNSELKLGSSQGLVLGEGGSFELVALGRDGVGAITDTMEEKRKAMAAMGARILADEGGAQISTETARIQRAGEHSVLAGIANTVADGMTQILRWIAEWAKISAPDIAVTLNTDFTPRGLQPGELAEWLAGLQAGTIPLAVVLEHFKSRGVVDPQMTEQDWMDQIDESLIQRPEPVAPPVPQPGAEDEDDDDAEAA
jgi:hypothetical protein